MLIISASIRIRDEARGEVTTALAPLISATHAEEGCHAYTFAWDVGDPTLLRFYEEWENQEALEAHLETEHVRVFNEALGPMLASKPEGMAYEAVGGRPFVMD